MSKSARPRAFTSASKPRVPAGTSSASNAPAKLVEGVQKREETAFLVGSEEAAIVGHWLSFHKTMAAAIG